MANAPVLLAGDIDRGGIFAQLYGTVKILPQDESDLIKALIVNKFRGDMALFEDGVKISPISAVSLWQGLYRIWMLI